MPTPYRYMSWNIKQFGEKAEKDVFGDTDVQSIASVIISSNADAVGVMEVTTVTGRIGMEQVLRVLVQAQPTANWLAIVTSNDGLKKADRNGFFWKESKIQFRALAWPDTSATGGNVVFYNRNPSVFRFLVPDGNPNLTYINFLLLHAPSPSEDKGNAAISAIYDISKLDPVVNQSEPIIISGDFNIDYNSNASIYNVITQLGYSLLFSGDRTSLSTKVDANTGNYLASAYDNIYLGSKSKPAPTLRGKGVFDFVQAMANAQGLPTYNNCDANQKAMWPNVLKVMRSRVSDHLPVWVDFEI